MDKIQLALQVRQVIADMGNNAVEIPETEIDYDYIRNQRRICLEKLVLYAGALSSLVLDDVRPPEGKVLKLAFKENQTI